MSFQTKDRSYRETLSLGGLIAAVRRLPPGAKAVVDGYSARVFTAEGEEVLEVTPDGHVLAPCYNVAAKAYLDASWAHPLDLFKMALSRPLSAVIDRYGAEVSYWNSGDLLRLTWVPANDEVTAPLKVRQEVARAAGRLFQTDLPRLAAVCFWSLIRTQLDGTIEVLTDGEVDLTWRAPVLPTIHTRRGYYILHDYLYRESLPKKASAADAIAAFVFGERCVACYDRGVFYTHGLTVEGGRIRVTDLVASDLAHEAAATLGVTDPLALEEAVACREERLSVEHDLVWDLSTDPPTLAFDPADPASCTIKGLAEAYAALLYR